MKAPQRPYLRALPVALNRTYEVLKALALSLTDGTPPPLNRTYEVLKVMAIWNDERGLPSLNRTYEVLKVHVDKRLGRLGKL